jgi:probable HAF family extracellular repeat protein
MRWTSGNGAQGLGDLPGENFWSDASGVSADGSVVVGTGNRSFGGDSVDGPEAFRWTSAQGMVGLGDLSGGLINSVARAVSADGAIVTGYSYSTNGKEGFRWTNSGGMIGLGGLLQNTSSPTDISADGLTIVGSSRSRSRSGGASTADGVEAFRWASAGGMVGLGDLPGGDYISGATAVSADGAVIVGFSYTEIGSEAFIWDAAHGMRNLRQLLVNELALGLSGWSLGSPTDISDDGRTIVGSGTNPQGRTEGWVVYLGPATVPEPSSIALAAVALLAGVGMPSPRRRA